MSLSNYPAGFSQGLTVRGLPIQMAQPGKVWWLNNSSVLAPFGVAGDDNGPGTYQQPFLSLNGAITKIVGGAGSDASSGSSRGDILMVMPGHAETISTSTAVTMNCPGLMVCGLGTGTLRPTFTFGTATTATINVSAADCSFINCLFIANYASVAACFTLTAAKNFLVDHCEFRDTTAILNFVNIVKTDTTSDDADGLDMENNVYAGLSAATNTCMVNMLGTNARVVIKNNYIHHAAVTQGGMMIVATGKSITDAVISGNQCVFVGATTATQAVMISVVSSTTCTGIVALNQVYSLCDTTPALVTSGTGLRFFGNLYVATADASGFLLPAVGS
ncbi:hypothetical protein UFOVP1_55 [uncultured Caudovirales phage]|uniref:Uncharacterized protein n=1 Tax=uncultured Caudovirales phage TaxID=2100421 RepID=A0A6J5KHG8_9CAUD|nr:hypothetical protein UFOVP1_55 [uncultured Caudovirales phage]